MHGLGVHDVGLDWPAHVLVSALENPPKDTLSGPRRTNDDDSNPLHAGQMQLEDLLDLIMKW